MSWTVSMWIQWRCPFCDRTTIFGNFLFYMHAYVLYTIFRVNSVVDSDYVIPKTIFENIWHGHHQALFSVWIQLWQWLCHLETTFWKYIIWSSPGIVFQCEFSWDSDYVISRLHFENIWYGHHQTLFFSVNSVVTVIVSSGGYILKIYDMVITRHCFHVNSVQQWLCHLKTIFEKISDGHHQT